MKVAMRDEGTFQDAEAKWAAGDFASAEQICRRLLSKPNSDGARALLAQVLEAKGRQLAQRQSWPQAKEEFQAAAELAPCWSVAWNNLANVHRRLGEFEDAERCLLRAVAFAPSDPDYFASLGHFYLAWSRPSQAEQCYRNAIAVQPKHVAALRGLSELLERQGRADAAEEMLRQWHAAEPENPDPLIRLGILCKEAERPADAEQAWQKAIAAKPSDLAGYGNLGQLYAEQGDWRTAERTYRIGLKHRTSAPLRILAGTCLPVIASGEEEIFEARSGLLRNLRELVEEGVRVDTKRESMPTLFYLAYHGENDREFHETMARLSTTYSLGKQPLPKRPRSGSRGRLRLGILSHFLRDHTIGRLNVGLFERLSRKQFEVIALPCQPACDPFAQRIVRAADQTVVLPPAVPNALETLRSLKLDMLLFADIGMMPFTYTLAFHRVAPVQLVAWGHPVTTGLPTIDYFLSSEALEPPGSDEFYSERLLRLPRLGVYYDPPEPRRRLVDRAEFGLADEEHLYICPQTLFKIHPRFDAILRGILQADPRGVLVLLEGRYPQWRELLLARWRKTMSEDIARVRFLPKLPRERFLDLLSIADVLLDPVVFGGGNTSYEAFGLGIPIVTWPDAFLRSRLTTAMYRQMEFEDLVVDSADRYVAQAVDIACNPNRRETCRQSILGSNRALFHDAAAIAAVEDVLLRIWDE